MLPVHVMVLSVALSGNAIPIRVSAVPAVAIVGTQVMLVTGTNDNVVALTVIVKSRV